MVRDVQFDILAKVRAAGVRGSAILHLSRPDAQRLIDGLQVVRSDLVTADDIDHYEGSGDDLGTLTYRLDTTLPPGLGRIEQGAERWVHISLADVIP